MSEIEEDFKELRRRLQLGVYVPKSVIMTEEQLNSYENVCIEVKKENETLQRENEELRKLLKEVMKEFEELESIAGVVVDNKILMSVKSEVEK